MFTIYSGPQTYLGRDVYCATIHGSSRAEYINKRVLHQVYTLDVERGDGPSIHYHISIILRRISILDCIFPS